MSGSYLQMTAEGSSQSSLRDLKKYYPPLCLTQIAGMKTEVIVKLSDKIIIAQNTLVVLCGIAGCGKSTFAAKHFLPTQIVSSDECRALICDDAMNQQVTGHAFELWRLIIRKRLLIGKTTVADATNLESGDRKWLLNTARYYNFFATVMVFDLPIETCLARNARRQRVVPEDALFRQYELFQASVRTIPDEGFDAVWVLDEAQQALLTIEKTPI